MNKLTYYPSLLMTMVAAATISQAQTILFSDNFESYTANSPLTGPKWSSITTATNATLDVVLDDGILRGNNIAIVSGSTVYTKGAST